MARGQLALAAADTNIPKETIGALDCNLNYKQIEFPELIEELRLETETDSGEYTLDFIGI